MNICVYSSPALTHTLSPFPLSGKTSCGKYALSDEKISSGMHSDPVWLQRCGNSEFQTKSSSDLSTREHKASRGVLPKLPLLCSVPTPVHAFLPPFYLSPALQFPSLLAIYCLVPDSPKGSKLLLSVFKM